MAVACEAGRTAVQRLFEEPAAQRSCSEGIRAGHGLPGACRGQPCAPFEIKPGKVGGPREVHCIGAQNTPQHRANPRLTDVIQPIETGELRLNHRLHVFVKTIGKEVRPPKWGPGGRLRKVGGGQEDVTRVVGGRPAHEEICALARRGKLRRKVPGTKQLQIKVDSLIGRKPMDFHSHNVCARRKRGEGHVRWKVAV